MTDVRRDGPWAIKLTVGTRRNDQQDCKLTFSFTPNKIMRGFALRERSLSWATLAWTQWFDRW